jgi:hypothetical protein
MATEATNGHLYGAQLPAGDSQWIHFAGDELCVVEDRQRSWKDIIIVILDLTSIPVPGKINRVRGILTFNLQEGLSQARNRMRFGG